MMDSDWITAALAEYEQPLIRYAAHILGRAGDVERAREVVQDVFLKLCRQDRAELSDHLAQWLYSVCRNRALDVLRKERRMTGLGEAQLNMPDRNGSEIMSALEREERYSGVLGILQTLPHNQQEVIRLKFSGDLSYQEISAITKLSVSNVGFLIHTGLKTIREKSQKREAQRRTK
ncbi:MAG: sigma-70 family RNA polymerase sigma factor [Acidobacteriota bacterium]|jgi:RNA polymerase sigma-70 factor (ECF subfamily)|nr:sigma-70 family RNA polymerase sigma factor [Acidobacteriota bacterium]